MRDWNALPQSVVSAGSSAQFKSQLTRHICRISIQLAGVTPQPGALPTNYIPRSRSRLPVVNLTMVLLVWSRWSWGAIQISSYRSRIVVNFVVRPFENSTSGLEFSFLVLRFSSCLYITGIVPYHNITMSVSETDEKSKLHLTRRVVLFPVVSVTVCCTVSWLIGHLKTWLFNVYFHDYTEYVSDDKSKL